MYNLKIDNEITLRPLQFSDAESFFRILDTQRKYLEKWLPWPFFMHSKEDVLSHVARCLDRNKTTSAFILGIFYNKEFVGEFKMHTIDHHNQNALLGFWISEEFSGKGIMTRVLQAKNLKYFFDLFKLNRMECTVAIGNNASRKLLARSGFQYECRMFERETVGEHKNDSLLYSITLAQLNKHEKKPELSEIQQNLLGTWAMSRVHAYDQSKKEEKKMGSWEKQGIMTFSQNGDLCVASSSPNKKFPYPVINHIFYTAKFELKTPKLLTEKYELHSIKERIGKRRNSRFELKDNRIFWEIKSANETKLVFEYVKHKEVWE
jgi:ribosomal-protein-serine acetyltransferase